MSEKVVLYHEALEDREVIVDPKQAAVLRKSGWRDVPRETLEKRAKEREKELEKLAKERATEAARLAALEAPSAEEDSQDLEETVYADPPEEPEDQED